MNQNIRFWASPWTPPLWMKTGYETTAQGSMSGWQPSYYDGGNYVTGNTTDLNTYAQYYTKWVQAYKAAGINIEYVSPQNEPGYQQNYPSCLWDSATYVNWVKVLGPAMSTIGVKVMLGTLSNNSSGQDETTANAVLADATAKSYVTVAGAQWGVLDDVNSGSFSAGGLPIWASETKCGNYPWQTSAQAAVTTNGIITTPAVAAYNSSQAPNDQAYGVEQWVYIRTAITKGKVVAYNAWNMVLNNTGLGNDTSRDWKQDALLVANGGTVTATPAYYVFRHLSQYVVPGATVVGTTGGDAVAFKNPDGSLVAAMYNSGSAATYIVQIGGKKLQFSMPANGWATVVLP